MGGGGGIKRLWHLSEPSVRRSQTVIHTYIYFLQRSEKEIERKSEEKKRDKLEEPVVDILKEPEMGEHVALRFGG